VPPTPNPLPPLLPQAAAKKKQRLDVNGTAAATGGDGETKTVFVGNLPWSATEEQISELFADCGEVSGVRIGESSLLLLLLLLLLLISSIYCCMWLV